MKFSQWIGIVSAIALIISGFMNWTWYSDIHKFFTGFYSENNIYGKPGKIFLYFCSVAIIFFAVPRIWAKRWNLLVCTIILAFAIRTFILYTACYQGVCPEKQAGIWLMMSSAVVVFLCALLPDLKLKNKSPE